MPKKVCSFCGRSEKEVKLLITGTTTGALIQPCEEIRFDLEPVEVATKGQHISIKVNERVRVNDKLYVLQPADRLTQVTV